MVMSMPSHASFEMTTILVIDWSLYIIHIPVKATAVFSYFSKCSFNYGTKQYPIFNSLSQVHTQCVTASFKRVDIKLLYDYVLKSAETDISLIIDNNVYL